MPNFNEIPEEFQVLSIRPDLRIRSFIPIFQKAFVLLFFLPFFVLFAYHSWMFLGGLYEILHLRLLQGIQVFSYDTGNPWSILTFFFTFFGLGFAFCFGLWLLLGVTEIHATYHSLTVSYKLLGISCKVFILVKDIHYFNQFLNGYSERESWKLEIVTNQRLSDRIQFLPAWFLLKGVSTDMITGINYKTVHLFACENPNSTEWLGRLLAGFYEVEFQSIPQSNNPVARRPH